MFFVSSPTCLRPKCIRLGESLGNTKKKGRCSFPSAWRWTSASGPLSFKELWEIPLWTISIL